MSEKKTIKELGHNDPETKDCPECCRQIKLWWKTAPLIVKLKFKIFRKFGLTRG
jgi:hypothetical protein